MFLTLLIKEGHSSPNIKCCSPKRACVNVIRMIQKECVCFPNLTTLWLRIQSVAGPVQPQVRTGAAEGSPVDVRRGGMGEFGWAVGSRRPAVWQSSAVFRAPGLQGRSRVPGKARRRGDEPGGPAFLRYMRWAFWRRRRRGVSLWGWRGGEGLVLFSGHAWRWLQRDKRNIRKQKLNWESKYLSWPIRYLGRAGGAGSGRADEIKAGWYGWNVQVWAHVICSGFPAFTHRGWVRRHYRRVLDLHGLRKQKKKKKRKTLMVIYDIFSRVWKDKHLFYHCSYRVSSYT